MTDYVFDSDRESAVRRALRGLADSVAGVSHNMSAEDLDRMYINLFHAVAWIRALHDLFETEDGYGARLARDHGGQIVQALQWTRDKTIHQLAVFHEARPRFERGPALGPGFRNGKHAVWLESDRVRLPDPRERPRDREKRAVYDRVLAGRPIWSSLAYAAEFLFMQAWTPGPREGSLTSLWL